MPLSVYIVARNEAANLPRCLASVREIADELVVLDTGSTDGTTDLARSFGATVHPFDWADDISAAHNAAIGHCTRDWVLTLDADEELLPDSRSRVRAAIGRPDAFAYLLIRQDVFGLDRPDQYTEMHQLRLFRRDPRLTMTRRYHQQFDPPLNVLAKDLGLQVFASDIRLRHFGYLPERRKHKLPRAARLLELDLHDRPDDLYTRIELGRTLVMLGNDRGHQLLAEVLDRLLECAPNPTPPDPLAATVLEYVFTAPPDRYVGRMTKPEALHLSLRWFPTCVPLLCRSAQHAYETHNLPQATTLLEKAFALGDSHTYNKSTSFDPSILSDKTRLNLGVLYVHTGQPAKAEAVFQRLCHSPTLAAEAQSRLAAIKGPTSKPN